VSDEEAAACLWHTSGLKALLSHVEVDGMRPTGLNPNLRFYRCRGWWLWGAWQSPCRAWLTAGWPLGQLGQRGSRAFGRQEQTPNS